MKIIGFLCNWCSYAGADLAGVSRFKYPADIRVLRVMCTGRLDPYFVLRAFEEGADGVLISGCHIGDCHYINANHWTMRRADKLWDRLEKLGIRPERMQLEWISSAEGARFARVMRDLEEMRQRVTPEEIYHTKEVLTKQRLSKRATQEKDDELIKLSDV